MARHHRDRDARLEDHSAPGGPVFSQIPAVADGSPDDRIKDEPLGFTEVARMTTSIGAAAGGYLRQDESDPNDLEQARLRLRDTQVALVALGYDVSTGSRGGGGDGIDGMWGPSTRNAIAEFQDEHDLPRSGQLNSETYEAILAEYESSLDAVAEDADVADDDEWANMQASKPLQMQRPTPRR